MLGRGWRKDKLPFAAANYDTTATPGVCEFDDERLLLQIAAAGLCERRKSLNQKVGGHKPPSPKSQNDPLKGVVTMKAMHYVLIALLTVNGCIGHLLNAKAASAGNTITLRDGWMIQSSANVKEDGKVLSTTLCSSS